MIGRWLAAQSWLNKPKQIQWVGCISEGVGASQTQILNRVCLKMQILKQAASLEVDWGSP